AKLPSTCSSFLTINDPTRNTEYTASIGCDQSTFSSKGQWIRFIGSGGTLIPLSPPKIDGCGTRATGWYNGLMPSVGQTVNGT
ncbi:unnamed protein product, partial [Rotaria magnacalcarata]